jgi:hypothetical protein
MIAIIVMLAGMLVVALATAYAVVRIERRADLRLARIRNREMCPRCRHRLPPNAVDFCPTCATQVRPASCRRCGANLSACTTGHCPTCGAPARDQVCPQCRYGLTGTTGDHCPECGFRVTAVRREREAVSQSAAAPRAAASGLSSIQPSGARSVADGQQLTADG